MQNNRVNNILDSLAKTPFRAKFHLKEIDKNYVREKGIDKIREHACDLITKRLAPAKISNDGRQTPMKGHPVFIAQHATGTCCRGCLNNCHHIPIGVELSDEQFNYVIDVIMTWIEREMNK